MQNTGRLANLTAHDGVYEVDGHGRPEQHAGGGELKFFLAGHPAGAPPIPRFLFPLGFAQGLKWAGNSNCTIERKFDVVRLDSGHLTIARGTLMHHK